MSGTQGSRPVLRKPAPPRRRASSLFRRGAAVVRSTGREPCDPSFQLEAILPQHDLRLPLEAVVHALHLLHVVEPADGVRSPEALAGLHRATVQLLDEADVAAL